MVVREQFTFSELEHWLNERRVTEIECLVPDLTGVARGKILPREKFTEDRGMRLPEATVAIGVTAGVLAATGVTVAVAQIPSTDGTVTACMIKPGGTIRLIDAEAGATCKKGEQLVSWNSQGQPGADGVSGYVSVDREVITNFERKAREAGIAIWGFRAQLVNAAASPYSR